MTEGRLTFRSGIAGGPVGVVSVELDSEATIEVESVNRPERGDDGLVLARGTGGRARLATLAAIFGVINLGDVRRISRGESERITVGIRSAFGRD